jgi:hypothetical protein
MSMPEGAATPDAGRAPDGHEHVEHVEPSEHLGVTAAIEAVEEETVQGLPVLAEVRAIERTTPAVLPAVQAAAVAATGFVAGAATVVLVKRHSARKVARQRSGPRRAVDMLPIVGSRTFLVDVHLLAKPGE